MKKEILKYRSIYAMIKRMLTMHTDILSLASCYAEAKRITDSTLAREATGSSTWLKRCASGRVTIRSAIAVVQWLSDHWPENLDWPSDIPRPSPSRGAFITRSIPGGTALSSDTSLVQNNRVGQNGDIASVGDSTTQALEFGMRLNASGQITSPAAFCQALGVRRYVYDDVVRRYRDGICAERNPRPGSGCSRVLTALSAAGDVRFASRRPVAIS